LGELGLEKERVEYGTLAVDEVRNFKAVAEQYLAKVDAVLNGEGGEE
jgi:coenzyme F420-reducing hydrogenase delta subunit